MKLTFRVGTNLEDTFVTIWGAGMFFSLNILFESWLHLPHTLKRQLTHSHIMHYKIIVQVHYKFPAKILCRQWISFNWIIDGAAQIIKVIGLRLEYLNSKNWGKVVRTLICNDTICLKIHKFAFKWKKHFSHMPFNMCPLLLKNLHINKTCWSMGFKPTTTEKLLDNYANKLCIETNRAIPETFSSSFLKDVIAEPGKGGQSSGSCT